MMILRIDRDTVKRVVEEYVSDTMGMEQGYAITSKKTAITKGGLVEITIERKKQQPLPLDEVAEEDGRNS